MKKSQFITVLIVLVIIAVGLGYYVVNKKRGNTPLPVATTTPQQTGSTSTPSTSTPGVSVVPAVVTVPVTLPANRPSLTAAPQVTVTLDAAVRANALAQIEGLRTTLKADPSSYNSWINLGKQFKLIGDYKQAEASWVYAGALMPKKSLPFYSLGDLYQYYLKDTAAAERNYKTAIANEPSYLPPYVALDGLYGSTDRGTLSLPIIEKGLTANPQNLTLLVTLANRYAHLGNKVAAKKYYEQALVKARDVGDVQMQETIQVAINNL